MPATRYQPGDDSPKPALLYPASYLVLTQAMTALLICVGLLGRPELAADIGVVQAATIATFFAFSGNARNLILSMRTTVPRGTILAARLALLLPLGAAAALLCISVARIDPMLAFLLIARRGIEWIGELHLSECELLGRHVAAKKNLALQLALLLAPIAAASFWPSYLLWAIGAWAFLPLLTVLGFVRGGLDKRAHSLRNAVASLLPHYGSTAVSGISLYAFRALLVLIAGKPVAGDLFVAFAIGSFPGTLFANVLGPTVSLHEERTGRQSYLPRALWAGMLAYLTAGVALVGIAWAMPAVLMTTGKSTLFWMALGCSLIGGAVMLVAQRLRLRLLAGGQSQVVFGADVLMYVCLIAAIPALYATGRVEAMAALYALNAVLSFLFYAAGTRGFLARVDPRFEHHADVVLVFFIFLPLFFLITGKLFNPPEPLFDSGGVLANLPLPISVLACGAGLLLLGRYERATPALWTILGLLVLMLVSTAIVHGTSESLERAKLLLMLQTILPMMGLVLGATVDSNGSRWPAMQNAILIVLVIVIPVQLMLTLSHGTFTLSHSLGLFGVYQHWQFVPVILVCGFLVVLPRIWAKARRLGRWAISLLTLLVTAYGAAALSVLAMAAMALGSTVFAVARLRKRDSGAIALVIVALAGLLGYNFALRNTETFRHKFDFLFPANAPFVSLQFDGVHRKWLGDGLDIVGLASDGILMSVNIPERARRATLVVEGELSEGELTVLIYSLRFRRPIATEHFVNRPGRFKVEIVLDRDGGDQSAMIFQTGGRHVRGEIRSLRWTSLLPDSHNEIAEIGLALPQPRGESSPRDDITPDAQGGIRISNIAERFSDWKLFGEGIVESAEALVFGHAKPLPREQRTSAHNFYLDFAYNFGSLALAPIFLLIAYTAAMIWRCRREVRASESLAALALIIAFLVLVESNLKVSLRQPYPGTVIYFLWGLLLARLAELDSDRKTLPNRV